MEQELLNEGIYYLLYKERKNPKKCYVGVKYPGLSATPFIVAGGKRAREIYNFTIQLLDNYGLKYSIVERKGEKLIKLPSATGLAMTIFLLTVYSTPKPIRYASMLERLISGGMPFMKHLTMMMDLAMDLSDYLKAMNVQRGKGVRHKVNSKAARAVSKMLIQLTNAIERRKS